MSLVTGLFFLVLLLNQRWSPPLRLQVSHCSTFRIMCDVPSMAVFYGESIECFLVRLPDFSLGFSLLFQWLQLLLVQSYISGSTFVVSLYINSCILTSFPLPFAQHFCLRVLPHISGFVFSLFFKLLYLAYYYYYYYPSRHHNKNYQTAYYVVWDKCSSCIDSARFHVCGYRKVSRTL